MKDLQQLYTDLGLSNVQTYIQSGNVIFQCNKTEASDLQKKIEKEIASRFGLEVPVIVRELSEIKQLVKNNSFLRDKKKNSAFMHITFLADEPHTEFISKILSGSFLPEEYVIEGNSIYLYCPNGYGRSKLNNNFWESKFKTRATTRNLQTLNKLIRIAEAVEKGEKVNQ